jgi:hypothetical protein
MKVRRRAPRGRAQDGRAPRKTGDFRHFRPADFTFYLVEYKRLMDEMPITC